MVQLVDRARLPKTQKAIKENLVEGACRNPT